MKRNVFRFLPFVLICLYVGVAGDGGTDPFLLAIFSCGIGIGIGIDVFIQYRCSRDERLSCVVGVVLALLLAAFGVRVGMNVYTDPNRLLNAAAAGGYNRIVLWSVRRGADVNGAYKGPNRRHARFPLYQAIAWRRTATAELLLSLGADPNRVDDNGEPVWSVAGGNIDMLRILEQHGADLNATSKESGQSALFEQMDTQHEDAVGFLLEHGANPNLQDDSGDTALMRAVCEPNSERLVALLLAHGADRSIKDKSGSSALEYAKKCNHTDAVGLLSR